MPITVLSDVVLPNSVIAAGVRGKNLRANARVATDNGYESINVIWSQTLRQYELGIVPLRVDQWQAIEAIHEITEGGAYGFLMADPKDSSVGDGAGIAQLYSSSSHADNRYQLYKRYTVNAHTKDRKITHPLISTISVSVSGVPLAAGAFTCDASGLLTIPGVNPPAASISWTGSFYVAVHFVDDAIDWELVTGGPADGRFLAGPSVLVQEVRE